MISTSELSRRIAKSKSRRSRILDSIRQAISIIASQIIVYIKKLNVTKSQLRLAQYIENVVSEPLLNLFSSVLLIDDKELAHLKLVNAELYRSVADLKGAFNRIEKVKERTK